MVIFTHFPLEADEDDIDNSNNFKKELNDELYKIFPIKENLINNKIPVYFINTKILNKLKNPHFQESSLRKVFDLIEEFKNRMNSSFGFSVLNSDNFNFIKNNNNNGLIKSLNELSNIKKEYEKIIFTTLKTQVKSQKHSHGIVLLYSNDDWTCDICQYFYQKNVSKYYCSFCDFNLCLNCNENNTKYSLGQFINPAPIKFNKYKFQVHQHNMIFCRSSRFEFELNLWCCNLCGRLYSNQTWSFYCTVCDYDICIMCSKNNFV